MEMNLTVTLRLDLNPDETARLLSGWRCVNEAAGESAGRGRVVERAANPLGLSSG
jgi:hypothetical protein